MPQQYDFIILEGYKPEAVVERMVYYRGGWRCGFLPPLGSFVIFAIDLLHDGVQRDILYRPFSQQHFVGGTVEAHRRDDGRRIIPLHLSPHLRLQGLPGWS